MELDFEERERLLAEARRAVESYAAAEISRKTLIEHLRRIGIPAITDPTGGDGYIPGTRDVLEKAVGEALLDEDDWDALVTELGEQLRAVPGD